MNRRMAVLALATFLAACNDGMTSPTPEPAFNASSATGAVFTMTNSGGGNEVVQFDRAGDGSLTEVARYATGGTGTGAGLGNQGGLILTRGGSLLLVVNAGSNDVSLFRRRGNGSWLLVDRVPSGGSMPISVTAHGRLAYVVNAGGDGNISGFIVRENGLIPLAGSTQPLSQAGGAGPAQIEFSPNGQHLVVTEKATNRIVTYAVGASGQAGPPVATPSAGMTPFGFGFRSNGLLVVSEAVGGAAGAGLVSTYRIESDGSVNAVDPAVPDLQSAPCWIVITQDGRFTYTTNTASNSISGFFIRPNGTLELLDPDGVTAMSDAGPIDAALTRGSSDYLYVLNAGGASITVYRVEKNGSLSPLPGGASGLAGANGLAAM